MKEKVKKFGTTTAGILACSILLALYGSIIIYMNKKSISVIVGILAISIVMALHNMIVIKIHSR